MCGIYAAFDASRAAFDADLVRRQCRTMTHRGPNDEGYHLEPGVALAMRRLSIVDLEGGHQPISNETGDIWIVFNGEIYNHRSIRKRLEARGHTFSTGTDTEAILHLYEERGPDCVQELNGMFGFAIWDRRKRCLLIARDRLGIKPLYYTRQGGRIQFASEIKALLEDPAVERKVNPNGLHHYLSYLYVPCPETMFEGIYKVPPGHTVVCTDGGERFTQYWDVSVREEPSMTLAEATEGLRAHLARSVDRRMMSDVPLGAYLSGGIDSSLIVALMAEASEEPVRTFTLGFGDEHEPFNEFRYAREVADAFSTDHHEFVAREEDVQQVLRDAVWHFDEPFGDGLHTGFISKMAKDHVTVALTGLGSDELFGGYGRHGRARRANLYGALPGILRRPFEWGLDRLPENVRRRFPFDKVGRMASRAGLPDWAFYAGEIDLMPTAFRREAYSDAFTADFKTRDLSGFLRRSVEDAPLDASQDPLAYLETKTTMVEDFLNYVDRMGMAHSMELRVPFLDHELVEFAGSIPLRHKVRGLGDTKYVLKQTAESVLPRRIVRRKKQPFFMPLDGWIRNDLRAFVEETLCAEKVADQGYSCPSRVAGLLADHFQRKADYGWPIWALLVFQVWHDRFVETSGVSEEIAVHP